MFVLYMAIVLYAVNVLRSVVQEKTNRVVEIMVAAAKPRAAHARQDPRRRLGRPAADHDLGGDGVLTINYRGALLGSFGVDAGDWNVPPLDVVDVVVILVYFLLGYFFYAGDLRRDRRHGVERAGGPAGADAGDDAADHPDAVRAAGRRTIRAARWPRS